MLPIFELVIDEESDGVNLVSFVGEPAIKANWVAFSEIDEELLKIQKEVMLSDYPEAAVNNAKRAIKHKEENGSSCGTQVGWIRARQIANKESFDEAMIKRIFSFLSRAKTYDQGKYVDENGSEICGSIMYDAWGGDAMKTWAERKLNQFENERKGQKMSSQEHLFQIESEEKRIVSGPILLADFPIIRADEKGEPYFVVLKAETIEKTAQKFFKNSNHLGTNKNHNKQELVDGVYMFESYIIDREMGKNPPSHLEDMVKDGSWFGSYKIENEQIWEEVKQGKFNGFSIEGFYNMKPMNFAEQVSEDEELIDILSEIESMLNKIIKS